MSTLSNRSLDASYIELLKIDPTGGVNTGISASLANVETGNGTASALRLSTTQVHSTGTLTSAGLATLNSAAVTNNATIGGTLGVTGLLTATGGVSGTLTGNVTGNVAGDVTGNVAGNVNGNVNGTIGATTPNSGSFTTLGASGSSTLSSVSATSLTVSGDASFTGSGGLKMPVGATAGATGRPASPAQGMLRYNTSLNQFEGYDGSSWAPIASGGGGGGGGGQTMYVRQTFTATASQTTFTITGGYTAYKLDVFQNGVKLVNSDVGVSRDVDVSNGTTIVLATGAAVGDVIDVIGLTSGNFAGPATARRQTYTATAGQTVFTVSGGYTVGQLDVFQNGTKLVTSVDVDVGNGSTFTLTTPAVAGDSLEVVGFTAADTVSGTLQFQAGTAAAPSITTFGDTNTGVFFPAADTIAFSEGGTESMRIDSSGNVGIGTSSPSQKLDIQSASASVQIKSTTATNSANLKIENNSTAYIGNESSSVNSLFLGTTAYATCLGNVGAYPVQLATNNNVRMTIDSSGNVGIGTASPAGKLHVVANQNNCAYTSSGTTQHQLSTVLNGNNANLYYGVEGSSTGRTDINATLDNASYFGSRSAHATQLISNNSARMTIDSSGNVGIGATSPADTNNFGRSLDIRSSAGAAAYFRDSDDASKYSVTGFFGADSNAYLGSWGASTGAVIYTSGVERLRIDSSGSLILAGSTAQKASGTTWSNPSDIRIKKNIRDYEKGLDSLMQVRVREWEYNGKAGTVADTKSMGVVADEVETILPDTVSTYKAKLNPEEEVDSDIKKFDATEITWLLVKAVQELSAKVTALEAA